MDFWQLLGLAEDKQKEKPSTSEGKFLSTKVNLVAQAETAETTLISGCFLNLMEHALFKCFFQTAIKIKLAVFIYPF